MPIDALTVDEVREAYEALIKEKDQRISELEKEVADLKEKLHYVKGCLRVANIWAIG